MLHFRYVFCVATKPLVLIYSSKQLLLLGKKKSDNRAFDENEFPHTCSTWKRVFFFISFLFTYVSLISPCNRLVRAGLVLTGSWWGVRRDANSHNLSLGADRLVARKFIQRVLSLHLPYFEVALSTLACRTWLCVHFFFLYSPSPSPPPLAKESAKKQRRSTHVCRYPCMCFSL